MVLGRLLSYWESSVWGAMLNFTGVRYTKRGPWHTQKSMETSKQIGGLGVWRFFLLIFLSDLLIFIFQGSIFRFHVSFQFPINIHIPFFWSAFWESIGIYRNIRNNWPWTEGPELSQSWKTVILLMEEILHQLRLVAYPMIFSRFLSSQVVRVFFHQQYEHHPRTTRTVILFFCGRSHGVKWGADVKRTCAKKTDGKIFFLCRTSI